MVGWRIVQTTIIPVFNVFLIDLMTMAAARASSPDVGSSMKMIEGLAISSTAIVSIFLCSVDNQLTPGNPTNESFKGGKLHKLHDLINKHLRTRFGAL